MMVALIWGRHWKMESIAQLPQPFLDSVSGNSHIKIMYAHDSVFHFTADCFTRAKFIPFLVALNHSLNCTVEPRLTATPLIRPPRYYGHFILARTKAQSVIKTATPLLYGQLSLARRCPY